MPQALRLLGYKTAEEAELASIERKPRAKSKTSGVALADLFSAGLLTDGERTVSLNGQWPAEAVLRAPGYITYNGVDHATPSAAASAVRDGGAANEWAFWGVVRGGQWPADRAARRA